MFKTLLALYIARLVFLNRLNSRIKKSSFENKINVYTKSDFSNDSQIKRWYKKSFTKDVHRYAYDLSPFKHGLWLIYIIDRKSFDRYLSIDQFNPHYSQY